MKDWVNKHRYLLIIVLILVVGIGMLAATERQRILKNTTETRLENPPRTGEDLTSSFYYDQLKEKEKKAFDLLVSRLEEKKGGVITFEEPLNGREYSRVCNALEYDQADYFYGFVDIPMNGEDQYLVYEDSQNILDIQNSEIEKCILFLYCAEGINEKGQYGEDGTVENLQEIQEGLTMNNQERLQTVEQIAKTTEEKLSQVIAELPQEYGQKETVDYFLKWIGENLTFDSEEYENLSGVTTMQGLFEQCYIRNNTSCTAEGKALASGFAKVLMTLCNRVGMESHVVFGIWNGQDEGYVMTSVKIGEETVYVDAAGFYAEGVYGLGGQKYLREAEFLNHMAPAEYFDYKVEE